MITNDDSYRLRPLKALIIRGPMRAPAEMFFLGASGVANNIVTVDEAGIEVGRLGKALKRVGALRSEFAFWRLGSEIIEQINDCDFVWLPDPWMALSQQGSVLAKRVGKPYVVTVWENIDGHFTTKWPLRHRVKEVLESAKVVHCVTTGSEQYVAEVSRSANTVQVYPGVDTSRFAPGSRGGMSRQPHIFLFVARLVEEKGVRDLVSAFVAARGILGDGIELVIVGDGPLRDYVSGNVHDSAGIRYIGQIAHDQLSTVMASCHTLVLLSKPRRVGPVEVWREQFGFVLVEAMACGLSIIGSDSGAIAEVIGDAGTVLPLGRSLVSQLTMAMVNAARDSDGWFAKSERSRRRALTYFDAKVNSAVLWGEIRKVV